MRDAAMMRVSIAIDMHPLFAEAMLEWAQEEYAHWPGDAYRAELAVLIGQLTAGVSAVSMRDRSVQPAPEGPGMESEGR